MTNKDLETLYGLLNKNNYQDLFRAFIVVVLGEGTYKRFAAESEDQLAIEAFKKVEHMYLESEEQTLQSLERHDIDCEWSDA